ncbi:hypothetical protein, partial [Mesorhizobium sp. M1C.F.Ca.ET.193.01.1.1]|uniref:hypothetical protein n=1 Tax=Mesorhizobium sp. M1C.F.Ca.ET.193.01.1.1 TaxID=2563926 RepID=UPI001AEEC763
MGSAQHDREAQQQHRQRQHAKIVCGEQITVQHKNQTPFDVHPTAAQWFASNHSPKTKDTSDGFNRRWLFLEFPRRIPDEKKVIDIDQIILAAE